MTETGVSARREAMESVALAFLGVVGIVVGVRSWAPSKVIPQPAPQIAPPSGGWPAMRDKSERVVRYVLSAKLDPDKHAVDASGTMSLRNVATVPIDHVRLHLYLNAFKNDRTIFRRARVGGFRGDQAGAPGFCDVKKMTFEGKDLWPGHKFISHAGESPQDSVEAAPDRPAGAPDDETDVEVPLPRKVEPGETIELAVEFRDELPEVSERTGYHGSFHFVGQWFPKFAKLEKDGHFASFAFHHVAEFYADYGTYDVTLDVPERFVVGASGAISSSKIEGGRRVVRHTVDDVHDFAWTAWDKFSEKTGTYAEGGSNVALRVLYPPGYDEPADRTMQAAIHGLRDKGARFGAYPYPVLTMVHPPSGADEAGGMEYPTLITTGGSGLPNHGVHEVESVTVHELGHQWFYGLVGTHEVEWPAGDEGLNSLSDELAMGRLFPHAGAVSLGPLKVDSEVFHRRGSASPFDEPIFQPAYMFATGRSYGARVYGGTAVTLLSVRNACGPEAFDAALGTYTRMHRFAHPKPKDLFEAFDHELGPSCGQAARLALTTPTSLDLYVEQIWSEKRNAPAGWFDTPNGRVKLESGKAESGYRQSVWIGRRGILDLPVDVELRFADGSRARRVIRFVRTIADAIDIPPIDAVRPTSWVRLDADGPVELVAAIVDPDGKIPLDRNRLNNWMSAPGKGGGAPVTRERAIAWIGLLVRGLGP